MNELVFQARTLASGTLASLTGLCRYDEIEPLQADFVEFCEENAHRYQTWQAAWKDFAPLVGYSQKGEKQHVNA